MSDDVPSTARMSPAALEPGDLWDAHRASGGTLPPCGLEGHRMTLSVAPEPRRYGFQCVSCAWQSGWFSR